MSRPIGIAGRRALALARHQRQPRPAYRIEAPVLTTTSAGSGQIMRAAATDLPPTDDGRSGPPSPADTVGQAMKRETILPTPEEIAERVYRLFCRDLRQEHERRGRWR